MTWLQFLLWVAGLYTLYYLLIILLDMSGKDRVKAGEAMTHELTFSETVEAQKLEPEEVSDTKGPTTFSGERKLQQTAEPSMVGSGGVSLKSLFSMARDEVILYTRPVSF
jgi:hypothetical protein